MKSKCARIAYAQRARNCASALRHLLCMHGTLAAVDLHEPRREEHLLRLQEPIVLLDLSEERIRRRHGKGDLLNEVETTLGTVPGAKN